MTEYTDTIKGGIGVLYYDGTCRMCVKWARRVDRLFAGRGLTVRAFEKGANEDEMRLHLNDGRELGGADVLWGLAGKVWWGLPLSLLEYFPGARPMMSGIYRRIASNRHCGAGGCELDRVAKPGVGLNWKGWRIWGLGIFIVAAGWWMTRDYPAWGLMWALAAAQYLAFKVMVLSHVNEGSLWRRVVFVFLWPGMDARQFLAGSKEGLTVDRKAGFLFALTGVVLLWGASGYLENTVLAGWAGMIGLIALLHFGVFALLAGFWQERGYGARPIMDAPWRAGSLAEFWGQRWNRAFSDVARIMVFRPLSRRWGAVVAMWGGFIFSGLAHELVITVPAGAGFGAPMVYFLIQALGVTLERGFNLSGGMGRLWVWFVVLIPAYGLFSPVFMERVIVPFLNVINK